MGVEGERFEIKISFIRKFGINRSQVNCGRSPGRPCPSIEQQGNLCTTHGTGEVAHRLLELRTASDRRP